MFYKFTLHTSQIPNTIMVTLMGIYHLDVFNQAALLQNTLFPSATLTRTEANWNTHVKEPESLKPLQEYLKQNF